MYVVLQAESSVNAVPERHHTIVLWLWDRGHYHNNHRQLL